MKKVKSILFIFMAVALFASLSELSFKSDVFARSMALCCNNGLCHDKGCTYSSTVGTFASNCSDYSTTCFTCIALIYEGKVCNYSGPSPTYCWNNGEKFYGLLD